MSLVESECMIKNANDIIWKGKDYCIKEFVDAFKPFLPLIVKVTVGYSGADDLHVISSGDVYRIFGIRKQKRMMVRDRSTGTNYSIPMKYPRKFLVIPRTSHSSQTNTTVLTGSKQTYTLEEIRQSALVKYPDTAHSLVLADQTAAPLICGKEKNHVSPMGELEPMDVFDEIYLVANSIAEGRLEKRMVTIPLYMPMEVTIGINVHPNVGNLHQWAWVQTIWNEEHSSFPLTGSKINSEIMEYDDDDLKDHEYEFIQPQGYIYARLPDPEILYLRNLFQATNVNTHSELVYGNESSTDSDYDQIYSIRPANTMVGDVPYSEYSEVMKMIQHFTEQRKKQTEREDKKKMQEAGELPPVPARVKDTDKKAPKPRPRHYPSTEHLIQHLQLKPKPQNQPQPFEKASHVPPVPPRNIPLKRLKTFSDVPQDLTQLTDKQVLDVLQLLKLDKYTDVFVERGPVDGHFLCEMDMSMLREDIGMGGMDAKKLWKFVQEGWRPRIEYNAYTIRFLSAKAKNTIVFIYTKTSAAAVCCL